MNDAEFGLNKEVTDPLRRIFSRYSGINKVILYGSRAMKTYKPGSDIDLTIIGPSLELSDLMKIENEIDDLLLPYKIDLSLFHRIENPSLLEHIQRLGMEFYIPS